MYKMIDLGSPSLTLINIFHTKKQNHAINYGIIINVNFNYKT